jgi:hypothetical protein
MTNKKSLVMMLAFAFLAVGNLAAQIDSRLNGTWVGVFQGYEVEYVFNNENYSSSIDGVPSDRGTYTINNGEIRWNITHFFGGSMNSIISKELGFNELGFGITLLESRWYSRNEFVIAFRAMLLNFGVEETEVNEIIYPFVSPLPDTISIDSNSLILTSTVYDQRVVIILTRK